jgi:hypothetical protein
VAVVEPASRTTAAATAADSRFRFMTDPPEERTVDPGAGGRRVREFEEGSSGAMPGSYGAGR